MMTSIRKKYLFAKMGLVSLVFLLTESVYAQTCASSTRVSTPESQFTIHNTHIVTDNQTKLKWMRCSLGQIFDDHSNTCQGDVLKASWAQALRLGQETQFAFFSDWRLPNLTELSSIVELNCDSPAINQVIFPNTMASYYWTSTPYISDLDSAWEIQFRNGSDSYDEKQYGRGVRLVRNITEREQLFLSILTAVEPLKMAAENCLLAEENISDCDTHSNVLSVITEVEKALLIDTVTFVSGVITVTAVDDLQLNGEQYVLTPTKQDNPPIDWMTTGSCVQAGLC